MGESYRLLGVGEAHSGLREVCSASAAFLQYLKAINSNGPDDKPFLSETLVRAPPLRAKGPGGRRPIHHLSISGGRLEPDTLSPRGEPVC